MGRRNTKLTVRGIINDVNPWLVVTFVAQYWRVASAEVTRKDMSSEVVSMDLQVLMSPQYHRSIPELFPVTGAETRALRLAVQGGKPSCYTCGSREHLRAFCSEQLEKRGKGNHQGWHGGTCPLKMSTDILNN